MAKDTAQNETLAKKLARSLKGNPDMTVQELAAEHGEEEAEVVRVLDSHSPDGKHLGEGAGGGWIETKED